MVTRRKVSRFASPIDRRPKLDESERGACSELPPSERAFLKIKENMRNQGKPVKDYRGWLKRTRGDKEEQEETLTPGEEEARRTRSQREKPSAYPQVKKNQRYEKPKREMK